MAFQHISVQQVLNRLDETDFIVADIRDPNSFSQGHIPGSVHLSNENIGQFMTEKDYEQPIVIVCYHGISSQGAANYLTEQGFDNVFSMDGGFTDWAVQCSDKIEK